MAVKVDYRMLVIILVAFVGLIMLGDSGITGAAVGVKGEKKACGQSCDDLLKLCKKSDTPNNVCEDLKKECKMACHKDRPTNDPTIDCFRSCIEPEQLCRQGHYGAPSECKQLRTDCEVSCYRDNPPA